MYISIINLLSLEIEIFSLPHLSNVNLGLSPIFIHLGSYALNLASFGQGTGIIYLDDVECIGNETRLVDCGNNGIAGHNCGHLEDASAVCQGKEGLEVLSSRGYITSADPMLL